MYIKVLSIGGFSRNARPFSFPTKEELTSEAERRLQHVDCIVGGCRPYFLEKCPREVPSEICIHALA